MFMTRVAGKYVPRIGDEILKLYLESSGAVLIEGPKWCGKTTSAKQFSASVVELGDPDREDEYMALANIAPSRLLEGAEPRLIDEWQRIPKLWDSVRTLVDRKGGFGHFILTGSASPLMKKDLKMKRHTGVGRIARYTMRPFTLFESGESNGSVSLKKLFSNSDETEWTSKEMDIDMLSFLCCRGGWPEVCVASNMSVRASLMVARSYVEAICSNEFEENDEVTYDRERMSAFMRSYARTVGSQQSIPEMLKDLSYSNSILFSEKTAYAYHRTLSNIFAIEEMPAWNVNLRSKTAIRTSSTRYFSDPSIATAAMGVGPGDLINDLKTFGFVFENLCMRDLRVYSEALDGGVYHYRDKTNLECDAVIHLANGKYGLVEIKLGGKDGIENGAKSLLKLKARIDEEKMGSPSFLMVLIGVGSYAYKREDGVLVVPIGLLGP